MPTLDPVHETLELLRTLDSQQQARALSLFRALATYLAQGRCLGVGVDGYPCGDPPRPCEECQQIWDLLEKLEQK